jgi:hypothetical protein
MEHSRTIFLMNQGLPLFMHQNGFSAPQSRAFSEEVGVDVDMACTSIGGYLISQTTSKVSKTPLKNTTQSNT